MRTFVLNNRALWIKYNTSNWKILILPATTGGTRVHENLMILRISRFGLWMKREMYIWPYGFYYDDFDQKDCSEVYKPGVLFRYNISSGWYLGGSIFVFWISLTNLPNNYWENWEKIAKNVNWNRESTCFHFMGTRFFVANRKVVYRGPRWIDRG